MVSIVGTMYGRLTILEDLGMIKTKDRNEHFVKVICTCGEIQIKRLMHLRSGNTKSCGCFQKEKLIKRNKKYSTTDARIYNIYKHMKSRCYNKKDKSFSYYGEKGINICDEWLGLNGFVCFLNWALDNGYSTNLTIDRIDNDKGYSPDNCRWATWEVQSANRNVSKNNVTGYTGVSYHNYNKKFQSVITSNKKVITIGYFKDINDAVKARNDYILKNNLPHKIQKEI